MSRATRVAITSNIHAQDCEIERNHVQLQKLLIEGLCFGTPQRPAAHEIRKRAGDECGDYSGNGCNSAVVGEIPGHVMRVLRRCAKGTQGTAENLAQLDLPASILVAEGVAHDLLQGQAIQKDGTVVCSHILLQTVHESLETPASSLRLHQF